jgi:hypothetical protein
MYSWRFLALTVRVVNRSKFKMFGRRRVAGGD